MPNDPIELLNAKLDRIADLLETRFGKAPPQNDLSIADAFVWQAANGWLQPVEKVNRVEIELLKGIDRVRDILLENTERFADGFAANNVLLWGARGMGKSSLVKAAHAKVAAEKPKSRLKIVEVHREDIHTLPDLLAILRDQPMLFLIFCDDLSFDSDDT